MNSRQIIPEPRQDISTRQVQPDRHADNRLTIPGANIPLMPGMPNMPGMPANMQQTMSSARQAAVDPQLSPRLGGKLFSF